MVAALSNGAGPLDGVDIVVNHLSCVDMSDPMATVESHWLLMMFSVI
jgi:hypothetical protein